MTITGELWTSLEQMNANNIRKWLYGTVLIRDWDPAGTTSLAGFTPFNPDGSLSSTLFSANNPGGPWYDAGAIDASGVTFQPLYKTTDTEIWQSRLPQRTDVSGDGEDVEFTLSETNPVSLQLYNNLPLSVTPGTGAVSAMQSIGASNFGVQYSTTPQIIYRQLLIIGVDGELTNPLYVAELRPRVSIVSLGKKGRMFNAKTQDCFDLGFGVYIDPASGFAKNAIYGGPAWLQLGGGVVLPTVKTVTATAVATHSATLVFNQPTSPNQPFTYTVSQNNTTDSLIGAATVANTSVSSGVVTVTVSGLTATKVYNFTVTATSANLQTASYPVSNNITAT